mgnify:FL=1
MGHYDSCRDPVIYGPNSRYPKIKWTLETLKELNFEFEKTSYCVNGSRGFNNVECMDTHMRMFVPKGEENSYRLVLGGARGADSLAKDWAIKNGVEYVEVKPDWNKHGKKAGILRNIGMLEKYGVSMLISFWDGSSKGTKQAMDYAASKDIPVHVIYYLE